ncbi:hypothetical protein [Streptomyces lunaelactis]|uniref:hypothetical protein n=1 Tax=Streptomyces lunaelactis TaxID=1535768 RepID=UPI001584C9C2|nr:hypothetical protein [Streptomyces lunaelactis]NUK00588.1 hypothetical protein [Streptomyces lunaelactis]NUK14749.1 hypothetical protein [Streptomyces lunaelactis]
MDINNEVVTVELDCDGWTEPYARDLTRRQLGELLVQLDDMGDATDTAALAPQPLNRPTPDAAYATAPCITSELGWTAYHAVGRPTGALLGREFWLRRAAVLDRIALGDEVESVFGDACEAATEAARRLLDVDQVEGITDPRGYVRQQYAHWATTK